MCKFTNSLLLAAGVVVSAGLAGTASAQIIYQDSFAGSNSTPLNGSTLTVDNGPSATWTANTYTVWADSGYTNYNLDQSTKTRDSAFLGFTPSSGQVYTLSATITLVSGDPASGTSTSNQYDWLGVGFLSGISSGTNTLGNTSLLNTGWDWGSNISPLDVNPWARVELGGGGIYVTGPYANGATRFSTPGTGNITNTLAITLNTGSAAWTYQVFDNGTAVSPIVTYSTNPTVTAVGLQNAGVIGTVSNFALTSSPVPEPTTLGLVGVGTLGLLLIGRKRKVV